jgi:hypothetical protein
MPQQPPPHSYKKGETGNKAGRPKGTPNKATAEAREAFRKLVTTNLPKMQEWLDQVAMDDPYKAIDLMIKMSEFVLPKLARQELTGADGENLFKDIKFKFGKE